MESFKSQSFFRDINSREINGFRVRKRPYIGNDDAGYTELGAVAIEHDDESSPPMALSFCKTAKNSHILAVTDEAGYISLYNTRQKFQSSSTHQENAEKSRMSEWIAHNNAIFDLCWIKEDMKVLTASGDQSIKVWDVQEKKCLSSLLGHTGSVKAISSHPTNQDMIVSGSRDGSFALWDLRSCKKFCMSSIANVHEAHSCSRGKRVRRGKSTSMSITSVLYLKDEVSIATAGAIDSIVKFWDTRNLKKPVIQTCPHPDSSVEKEKRLHGISSLSQDLNGVYISASCMDSRIYLYSILSLEKGPVKTFSGCRIDSFFVKSALSPDGAHILGGSSDGNAYIWQVKRPELDPITLGSHDGEVTAVDWCPSEMGKIATSSDDFTVRYWSIQSSCYSNARSPSSIRRRVMAPPIMERKKLFVDQELKCTEENSENCPSDLSCQSYSADSITACQVSTPESQKKRSFTSFEEKENLEKSPEATSSSSSPSSVLNPPSSSKRKTIKDYFLSASSDPKSIL
ncbi:hypothetical protein M9H77_15341 [Catharanthus roseus]|uniref:Uncharacterized protein n=1 Tax=Catharanthus roseus TaxID=4058 RepID=A0ACC0AX05_CATRO|nr:hypothetical protein M9H77_15341 [Catharanthus roseus]